ncbi:MAG: TldD/PmbA family protein, partial [Proteobacteria bacterium]|nr:TldD/PmbA family protein [Pseudomonadota bacterium]
MQDSLNTLVWLLEKTRKLGADAADSVCFETTDVSARQRLGQPEGIERSETSGLALRAFVGNKQAIVSSSDMTQPALQELAERAIAMARAASPDADGTLAPADRLCSAPPELDLYDAAEPDMPWLMQQCREAEDTARAVPGISNSEGADTSYSRSRISLAISGPSGVAFAQSYRSSFFSVSLSVLAGEGTGMERDYAFTSARHRADLSAAT